MSARHVRLRAERKVRRRVLTAVRKRERALVKRIGKIDKWLKDNPEAPAVPGNNDGWMAGVARTQTGHGFGYRSDAGNKLVWHTTEGSSIPNYKLGWPHFTLDIKRNLLEQHIPITQAAQTLRNEAGPVETNSGRHTIQVEIVGFAKESHTWSDGEYAQIRRLSRWIEKHAGVPRKCDVVFRDNANHKVSNYHAYQGHIGHQHIPENDHWDPGKLDIKKVLS